MTRDFLQWKDVSPGTVVAVLWWSSLTSPYQTQRILNRGNIKNVVNPESEMVLLPHCRKSCSRIFRYHCWWWALQYLEICPELMAIKQRAVLYRAIPVETRDLGFCGLTIRTIPFFDRLLRRGVLRTYSESNLMGSGS